MNTEQFISLADALRSYALTSGRDMNASNMFVHGMLMRAIEGGDDEAPLPDYSAVRAPAPHELSAR